MDAATKKNLIITKKSLFLTRRGHDLLEKKFFALQREIKRAEKDVKKMREALCALEREGNRALASAGVSDDFFFELKDSPIDFPPYKLDETTVVFDTAFFLWREIFAAREELELSESRLANLKNRALRTRKRAAALGNVIIPKHERRLKYISERLEEHERDEVVRQKAARR
ncbi:MAG: V-type ATP synthase subunit D [Defluviitaleaceae bacterium]|nr:V-type ATP synthase subunit D [Defluviitaleaceae bacterium]